MQQPSQITATAHVQSPRNPRQRHGRLRPDARRQFHLGRVSFAPRGQILLRPSHGLESLVHSLLRSNLHRFLHGLSVVAAARTLGNLFQQFAPKLLPAQAPASLNRLELCGQIFLPAALHALAFWFWQCVLMAVVICFIVEWLRAK